MQSGGKAAKVLLTGEQTISLASLCYSMLLPYLWTLNNNDQGPFYDISTFVVIFMGQFLAGVP